MLTWNNKTKLALFAAGLCLTLSTPALACNPLNPICLFQMVLKATPGLPVMDFASIPAVIPHVPAAIAKEAQSKVKEIGDKLLQDLRSGKVPSMSSIDLKPKVPEFEQKASGDEIPSLAGFPQMDADDPLDVAKSIEVLFVRPGDPSETMTQHDISLMNYQRNQFNFINSLEIKGYIAEKRSKLGDVSVFAEHVKNQMEAAKDLNEAYRANYAAHHMDYRLMLLYNQLLAANLQTEMTDALVRSAAILNEPVFGNK